MRLSGLSQNMAVTAWDRHRHRIHHLRAVTLLRLRHIQGPRHHRHPLHRTAGAGEVLAEEGLRAAGNYAAFLATAAGHLLQIQARIIFFCSSNCYL